MRITRLDRLRWLGGGMLLVGPLLPAAYASAPSATLSPSLAMAAVASEAADQYYVNLLKWSRDVVIGRVTARVTYLDPPLYLAWLRQSSPTIDQGEFERRLSGFPNVLRFRVAFQAAERHDIHAKDWKVALEGIASGGGIRIAPIDLLSGKQGDYWEDDWDYRFQVPAGFLDSAKGFRIALAGPAGRGEAVWQFGVQSGALARPDGYVPFLGGALSLLCVAVSAALFVTRPPRARAT